MVFRQEPGQSPAGGLPMSACWMIRIPKIVLVYVYPNTPGNGYLGHAARFANSYSMNPAGFEHSTVVVCNGGSPDDGTRALFQGLPSVSFMQHDNSGWDIGAYQAAVNAVECDLMIFCGAHAYFRAPGWLLRIWEVYDVNGPALYGATGSQGNGGGVQPHVRTTGFWCPPRLMKAYPHKVTQGGGGGQRYEMEHGHNCLSNYAKAQNYPRLIVGWDDVKPLEQCDSMLEGFHKGNQNNLLIGDRLCCPPFYHTP